MEKSQDDSWFQDVYDHYRRQIFGRCFSLMHNQEDAEDMTHETFLRAFASPTFPSMSPDHQRNWLFKTARHRCFSKLGRPMKEIPPDEDDPGPEPIDPSPTPQDLVLHKELKRKLNCLSYEERYAAMARARGCTFKEIGEALGCSTTAAFNHYENAIARLKRLYEDDRSQ